jgi:DHA2 family multidrug resistance protein-like MFS transporter
MVTTTRTPAAERAGRRQWTALAVLALPLLLVSMDVSILYFAVPEIARDLHATSTQQLWTFDVYGFVLAGLLVTMGAVADRVGARRLLLVGAVAFSATSLVAAYAQSAGELIAARALLGIGGATLMPSTMSMIRTLFHDERQRGQAIGIWTGVMTAGVGLGPVLSGVLLQHFWWGSVFLVNLPAMVLLLAVGPVLLPKGEVRRGTPFDALSSVLSLAAVLPTIYGIKEWAAHGTEPQWVVCILAGLALGAVFLRRQLRHPHAMIDADLLRNRVFATAVGTNAVSTFALVGNAVFMTAYLQLVLGYSPLRSALWSLVPTVGVGLSAPFASGLAAKLGPTRVAAGGLVVAAGGFGVLTLAGTGSLVLVLVGAGVLACGLVGVMTVGSELVLAAVKPAQAASGAAVSEAGTELGGALGIALLGSIGTAAYRSYAGDHLPVEALHTPAATSLAGAFGQGGHVLAVARDAYVHGLHVAALTGAAVLLLAALAVLRSRLRNE